MAKFKVSVDGANYQVEAPDEETAWQWANVTHHEAGMRVPKDVQAARDAEAGKIVAAEGPGATPSIGVGKNLPGPQVVDNQPAPGIRGPVVRASLNTPVPPASTVQNSNAPSPEYKNPNEGFSFDRLKRVLQGDPWAIQAPGQSFAGRVVRGAADLPVGAMQVAGNVVGLGKPVNEAVSDIASKIRPDDGGFDFARLLGNMIPIGAAVAPVRAGLQALRQNLLERMLGGAAAGTLTGVTAPVDDTKNYAADKVKQIATSEALGGAIPAAGDLIGGVAKRVRQTADLVLPGGVDRIKNAYYRRIIGEDNVPAVRQELQNSRPIVPGSEPTARDVLVHRPEGSPIVAQQDITARTPGGVSAEFGHRVQGNQAARDTFESQLQAYTDPIRVRALDRANVGKIDPTDILTGWQAAMANPEMRGSKVGRAVLNELGRNLAAISPNGVTDAYGLHTIRKDLGANISKHIEKAGGAKVAAGFEMDLQKAIDAAIANAERRAPLPGQAGAAATGTAVTVPNVATQGPHTPGGFSEWQTYLDQFSRGKKMLEADLERTTAKPPQKTDLRGGVNIAEETRTHLPNMLYRPTMLANAVLKLAAGSSGIEPKLDRAMAQDFLHPDRLAAALQDPNQQYAPIIRAILERGLASGGVNQMSGGQ